MQHWEAGLEAIVEFERVNGDSRNRLQQLRLLNERDFIQFLRDLGQPVCGAVTGDPTAFHQRGLLHQDDFGEVPSGGKEPLFHPFRFLVTHELYKAMNLSCCLSFGLEPDKYKDTITTRFDRVAQHIQDDAFQAHLTHFNALVKLCIQLEAAHWPDISGQVHYDSTQLHREYEMAMRRQGGGGPKSFSDLEIGPIVAEQRETYKAKIAELLRQIGLETLKGFNERLRQDGYRVDPNDSLYLLLRAMPWEQRFKLKGTLAGAMWIRHMAELIRLGVRDAFNEELPEEDQAFGMWYAGGRERFYGFERPIDNLYRARRYISAHFGLPRGGVLRWYVEGETEWYFIKALLEDPSLFGIELVNLRGVLSQDRDNIALKLGEWVDQDFAAERFSVLSFDADVPSNKKLVKRLVDDDRIVGGINSNSPDFEFANFTIGELVEIAARLDESEGGSGQAVRQGDWSKVHGARQFEERYLQLSSQKPRSLKGEAWAKALAAYANDYPKHAQTGQERPILEAIGNAVWAERASWRYQREKYQFNPDTFSLVVRESSAD